MILVCGLVLDSLNKKPDLLLHFFGNEIPLILFPGNAVSWFSVLRQFSVYLTYVFILRLGNKGLKIEREQ